MKLFEFLKKYQLILILSFLVVVLIFIKLIYGGENKNQINEIKITPTPTVIPTIFLEPTINLNEVKKEISQDINYNYPLGQILPYSTENFIIERYTKPLVLEVEALNTDKVLVEKEVLEWIAKNEPDGLNHKIVWK